ncbi:MAG: hypothetical protein V4671_18935 [Armatimonadota bacterium]
MTKAYDSPAGNDTQDGPTTPSSDSETGRKGGSTAAMRPGDESPVRTNDYTSTTSEKSSARYLVPLIIAAIVIVCVLALRSRFAPTDGARNGGVNPAASTATETRTSTSGPNTTTGR